MTTIEFTALAETLETTLMIPEDAGQYTHTASQRQKIPDSVQKIPDSFRCRFSLGTPKSGKNARIDRAQTDF